MIVEVEPSTSLCLCITAAGEGAQIDAPVFEGSPRPLDEDVVEARPLPSMEMRTPASYRQCVLAHDVNWLPCSVSKIFGRPCQSRASSNTWTQNWTSMVSDSRHVRTFWLCQSMITTR